MKKFVSASYNIFLAVLLLCLALPATGAAAARDAGFLDNSSDSPRHYVLPGFQFGYEVITEGTQNYTVQRTMRKNFPFDMDITVIYAWGYTGDTFKITVTDKGDKKNPLYLPDRLFAVATAVVNGRATTEWGTMYSAINNPNSFDVTVPTMESSGYIYVLSGYFTPSLGDEPYSYSLTFTFTP
jgi:hypothetical protein